ncbi:hypothetical protein [Actinomadura chokoriensis]|uniref:hypothetical protein n=1 Tax=Actinomadura chokoriensis TaxID=454156 RepID=UPI0031F76813
MIVPTHGRRGRPNRCDIACRFERKTGWIVVVPVHRLRGSRKEIEGVLMRYGGPYWGGNA